MSQKPKKKRRVQHKQTKGDPIPIEDVFAIIKENGDGHKKFVSAEFHGEEVNLGTLNIRMHYHKGVDCIMDECEVTGAYFKLERSPGPPHIIYSEWHLNLYGVTADGREVLMTKDHRHPRSKGGPDTLDNLDPMCTHCNAAKADKV